MRKTIRGTARRIAGGLIWFVTAEAPVRAITAIAALVTIAGFPIALWQLADLREQRENRSIQILMLVDQQLSLDRNVEIRHAIERGVPVLRRNGGRQTDQELGDYLDVFEGLADAHEQTLVDLEAIYVWHSYHIEKAHQNKEVADYITRSRLEDPDFYTGFEALAKKLAVFGGHLPPRKEKRSKDKS